MLGSAGCGYEYKGDLFFHDCEFLQKTAEKNNFKCLKYNVILEIHNKTNEPFRYKKCRLDAERETEKNILIKRKKEDEIARDEYREWLKNN